ncbi:hypothetical protein GCT13_13450 [Paraburkholderia sp. CNPSo 3157]|uniref:Uncharacterized protein n=1 Tax=Paraburkholderia franconis TaxID=2654983 RepID=A0A7X1NAC9_9BURK|nr:hypothetical protein [Paraburkholderia franconis]MPW17916.1 hypothetical protein [Paraburkholderia franconis]
MAGFPKVTHRVITAETFKKEGVYWPRLAVVTHVDTGADFTEYAYGEKPYESENEAWLAAKYMEHRWQVPELIRSA